MSARSIIVLGNGFDVALDYKTKYSDFYANSQELRKLSNSGNALCKHILDDIKGCLWSDLEIGLYEYSLSITKQYGEGNVEQAERFQEDFNELRKALFKYLNNETHEPKLVEARVPVLGLNNEWSKLYPEYLTFNYSITTFNTACKNTRAFLNSNDSINNNVFIYQHGSIYDTKECKNNTPQAIVVGIDEESQKVETLHSFLYKSHQNIHNPNDTIPRLINKSLYIIYGCSLGKTDASYFKHIFHIKQVKKTFIIYYYGESSLNTIKTNISCYCSLFDFMIKNNVYFLNIQSIDDTRKKTAEIIDSFLTNGI